MKKQAKRRSSENGDGMRPEYDFSQGERGKHAAKYAEGANVVVLEPDVAREFKTAQQVNDTLRAVSKLLQQQRKRKSRKTANATMQPPPIRGHWFHQNRPVW